MSNIDTELERIIDAEEAEDDGRKRLGVRITVGGRTVDVMFGDLGPHDEMLVRAATAKQVGYAMSLQRMMDAENFGIDSIAVLFWIGRMKDGERKLTLKQTFAQFPKFDKLEDELDVEEIFEDGEDDSPEV